MPAAFIASDSQGSEGRTGAPETPAPARADVSADAALIVAAVGRIETVAREERAALDRLRIGLGEMANAIAQAKAAIAVAPEGRSIATAALLDEFEHLVDAMIEIAAGSATAAAVAVAAGEPALADAGEVQAAGGAAEAKHDSEPPPARAAEGDQVPTVSGVVSRLGPDHDATDQAAAEAARLFEITASGAPTVAMLKAMVEALNASVPAAPAAEAAELEVVAAAEPAASPEIAEMVAPAPEPPAAPEALATEPAAAAEIPDRALAEVMAQAAVALAEYQPPPPDPAPAAGLEIAPEPDASDDFPYAWADPGEVASPLAETAEAAPVDVAAEPMPTLDVATESVALESAPEPAIGEIAAPAAEAAPDPGPDEPILHELDLIAMFERMEAFPILPPEVGTAVIFPQRSEPAPEHDAEPPPAPAVEQQEASLLPAVEMQVAAEPAAEIVHESAAEIVQETTAAAATPDVAQGAEPVAAIVQAENPIQSEAAAEVAESDFDPEVFLFGPDPAPEQPAAAIPESPPRPDTAVAIGLPAVEFAAPRIEQPHAPPPQAAVEPTPSSEPAAADMPNDPLAPLKAMSAEERIALFS